MCVTASLAKGPQQNNGDWEVGSSSSPHPRRPPPGEAGGGGEKGKGEEVGEKGEEVGEKEMERERGTVNKELPLCEVLRWVQGSPLPEGPRFVRHPTREPFRERGKEKGACLH